MTVGMPEEKRSTRQRRPSYTEEHSSGGGSGEDGEDGEDNDEDNDEDNYDDALSLTSSSSPSPPPIPQRGFDAAAGFNGLEALSRAAVTHSRSSSFADDDGAAAAAATGAGAGALERRPSSMSSVDEDDDEDESDEVFARPTSSQSAVDVLAASDGLSHLMELAAKSLRMPGSQYSTPPASPGPPAEGDARERRSPVAVGSRVSASGSDYRTIGLDGKMVVDDLDSSDSGGRSANEDESAPSAIELDGHGERHALGLELGRPVALQKAAGFGGFAFGAATAAIAATATVV